MSWGDAIKGVLNVFTGGLSGGIISIVQSFLGNKKREDKLNHELKSQQVAAEAKRKRALIQASRGPPRFIAIVAWLGPFVAPLWPGITIDMTTGYVDQVIDGMPEWYRNLGLVMFSFIWGGAEWKGLIAERDDERMAQKEIERDTADAERKAEESRERQNNDHFRGK